MNYTTNTRLRGTIEKKKMENVHEKLKYTSEKKITTHVES